MAIVLALDISNGPFAKPEVAVALAGAALAWTFVASVLARTAPGALLQPWALAVEVLIAGALLLCDGLAYGPGNDHSQTLGSAWPLAVILTIGVAQGAVGGFVAGAGLGAVRLVGQFAFDQGLPHGDQRIAAAGTIVFYALAGAVAGFVMARLRTAEREVALARARDEVARTLHDGVLQTLAIVQRRSDDRDLVALARDQEQDLRGFLLASATTAASEVDGRGDLEVALREVAASIERRDGLRTTVVTTGDVPLMPERAVKALQGAVGEALTNAVKHGDARSATVFAEPDELGVFCSVKDDGAGFDPASAPEGMGLRSSIRGRVDEVGGRVEIDGGLGHGAEVRLWVPL
jgi:signal transduction histidine kinase